MHYVLKYMLVILVLKLTRFEFTLHLTPCNICMKASSTSWKKDRLFLHLTLKNLNGAKDKNKLLYSLHAGWFNMTVAKLLLDEQPKPLSPLCWVEGEKVTQDSRGLQDACDPKDYKRYAERWWACWLLWCHSAHITFCWQHKMLLIIHGPVTTCLSSS